jgi:hypothetical protein
MTTFDAVMQKEHTRNKAESADNRTPAGPSTKGFKGRRTSRVRPKAVV